LLQRLLDPAVHRHRTSLGRGADNEENVGLLRLGATADLVEETHRAGGVCERHKARCMQGGDQKPGGDAHRLGHVVVLDPTSITPLARPLPEDGDQHGSRLQKALVLIRAQGRQGIEPLLRRAALVEVALLDLRLFADAPLDVGIGDHGEMPGLEIGA
jgi:hypothetical protein